MLFSRFTRAVLFGLLWFATPLETLAGRDVAESLLDSVLAAAGPLDAETRQSRRLELEQVIEQALERIGPGRPTGRRARRLHRVLHRRYLHEYSADADDVTLLPKTGNYNCVSAALLYALVARRAGFDVRIMERPDHLWVALRLRSRTVEIETTRSYGYDLAPSVFEADNRPPLRLGFEPGRTYEIQSLTAEETIGVIWLNRAWRELERGDATHVAGFVERSVKTLGAPNVATESTLRLLSRAFRFEYERGRFDLAARLAGLNLELYPGTTSAHDRVLAAALKRIEQACADGAPERGAAILGEISNSNLPRADLRRLERRGFPLIAAAAARLANWDLAQLAVSRYSLSEPDPIEASRLEEWVRLRRAPLRARESDPLDPLSLGSEFLPDFD